MSGCVLSFVTVDHRNELVREVVRETNSLSRLIVLVCVKDQVPEDRLGH